MPHRKSKLKKKTTKSAEPFIDTTRYLQRQHTYEFGSFDDLTQQPGVNLGATAVLMPPVTLDYEKRILASVSHKKER
jgi:hypothetical protein